MSDKKIPRAAVILAAGLGTRMKSTMPKVLHEVASRPMLHQVVQIAKLANCKPIIVVLGPEFPQEAVPEGVETVVQHQRLGTADAVKMALPILEKFAALPSDLAPDQSPDQMPDQTVVLILAGDVPLITVNSLEQLASGIQATGATVAQSPPKNISLVVAGFRSKNPKGYGRLIINFRGNLKKIVEEKDATRRQRKICFCNGGAYAVRLDYLAELLPKIKPNNAAKEYYLTDIVGLARQKAIPVTVVEMPEAELLGVNSRSDLARVEAAAQARLRAAALDNGVTLRDSNTVTLSWDTQLAEDIVIEPFVVIGRGVSIESGAVIRAFSHLVGAKVGAGAIIGPYARLRPGTVIAENAHVGNFVELKNTHLGAGAKANHLSYLGDATIGADANIGAGTITCNYDGFDKHKTIIGAGVFIGSNSALVAPVEIGEGAIIGAGSVISQTVPADSLAVTRPPLTLKRGWAAKFRTAREYRNRDRT